MKTTANRKRPSLAAETRLKGFIGDNYNFFVIGYGPTERPSDAILSLTGAAKGVGLCFIHGASLPDPQKILLGSGNQTRFIRADSVEVLPRPAVEGLITAA